MDPVSIVLLRRLQAKVLKREIIPRLLGKKSECNAPKEVLPKCAIEADEESSRARSTSASPAAEEDEAYTSNSCELESNPVLELDSSHLPDQSFPEETQECFEPQETDAYVDEQALRDAKYVGFDGEAEEDYTAGPCRMIEASDGVQTCTALLMKLDLSAKIQEAITFQRTIASEQQHAAKQEVEIERFERQLEAELANYDVRIARAERQDAEDQEDNVHQEGMVAVLKQKHEILRVMAQNLGFKRTRVERNIASRLCILQEMQSDIITYFEEVFVSAMLVEPADMQDDEPVEHFDLQVEYQKTVREMQGYDDYYEDDYPEQILETGDEFMRPKPATPTSEQQAEAEIRNAFWAAKDRVNNAQLAFDRREMERDREYAENCRAAQDNRPTTDATRTEFDLRWVQRNRELTHEVVEAEEQLSDAKAAAVEANIEINDQGSYFGDNASEISFAIDSDQAAKYAAPAVGKWLEDVSPGAKPEVRETADVDEWDHRDVDMSDSASCVDYYSYRNEIDNWQQVCRIIEV